jgi:threonine dehydratase
MYTTLAIHHVLCNRERTMISISTIYKAHDDIRPHVLRTPLVAAQSLSSPERQVRMKLESLQPIGAFKLRGAVNAIMKLSSEQLQRGVVCASTGNHGRALAYAAQLFGCRATVCMSSLVPSNKVQAIETLGADIRINGNSQDEAQELVNQLVANEGMTEIPPFDHADIIAGQGTIGLEIIEDWPEVDTILVGLSGGGLLSGIALAVKSLKPDIHVIGISPERGAAMAASLQAGQETEVEELATLADSLGGGIGVNNQFTFSLTQRLVDEVVLLNEAQIAAGMRHLFWQERLVTEGAAAVGAALLVDPGLEKQYSKMIGRNVALIISGQNIDMQQFTQLVCDPPGSTDNQSSGVSNA